MGSLSIGETKASALDDALTRLHATDLEYRSGGSDGLSNHGPMAAETLEALGATDTELASAGAKLYLRTPAARFTYMHTLTGSVALRRLGSAIPAAAMPKAVGYALQAVAALLAINGAAAGWDAPWTQATAAKPEAITQAAVGSNDDHTIKFVEAALSEHTRTPRPEFLAAAAHRVGMR